MTVRSQPVAAPLANRSGDGPVGGLLLIAYTVLFVVVGAMLVAQRDVT